MSIRVRKIIKHIDETRLENGRVVDPVHRVAFVGAIIENPYPSEYVQDLVTLADELGEEIGKLVGPACVELLGGPVEAFGKAASCVGIDGEVEHGSALIHNLHFGNVFRTAADRHRDCCRPPRRSVSRAARSTSRSSARRTPRRAPTTRR
ncbi:hypothetical protein SHIRM173S_09466 [Streptomyces hirsutus]